MKLAHITLFVVALATVPSLILSLSKDALAQSLNQLGIARLNQDAQTLWAQDGLPMARQIAQQELQKLVGVPKAINSNTTAKIVAINSITLDCPFAPGLTRMDGQRIEGRLPLTGSWRVVANVRVNLKGRILGIPFEDTFNVEAELKSIVANVRCDLDSTDPSSPRIAQVHPPVVGFNVRVSSANFLVQVANWLTSGWLNPVANGVARVGGVYLAQKMNLVLTGTPQIIGAGGPALAPVAPTNLEAAALKIEAQARATKMPFGTPFEMSYRDPYLGTWEQSLNDPNFQLVPTGYESIFDSTTYHGEWLGGVAYRYAVTRSPQALAEIRLLLKDLRILLTMKGQPGNLNRLIMPLSEFQTHFGALTGDKYVIRFQGVDYVASDYISRDCYFGTFFGLSHTFDLVDDPAVRAEAKALLEMTIDYLLANNWTWRKRDGSFGERWQGVLEQQYAWLLAAKRVNPAKYSAVCAQYKGFTDLLWSGFWIAVMDPYYSYYKFELGSASLHVLLRLETDPIAWQRAYQGMAIQRRHIGHHQNALFNGFYMASDASSVRTLGAESANLLTRWLRQPRRKIVIDVSSDPTIGHMPYTLPVDVNLLYPGGNTSPQTIEIATHPIPVERRASAGFAWSVSPMRLKPGHPVGVKPHAEGEGMDITLPYWMARYYRGILPPRPIATSNTSATSVR